MVMEAILGIDVEVNIRVTLSVAYDDTINASIDDDAPVHIIIL